MRFLVISTFKDLRRHLADPVALVLTMGIPLMIGSLIALVGGGGDGAPPKAHLLVVDQDDSFVSNFLAGAAGQEQMGEFIEVETVNLEEGRERIDAGEASALLIIPDGFGEAVLEEKPTTLTLVTNPAQQILPAIIEEGLDILVDGSFYLQRVIGEPLRKLADGPPEGESFFENETIASVSADINQRFKELDAWLFPPVLQLENEIESTAGESFDFGLFMLPGILFMALLFVSQGLSADIWTEKEKGTLRRVVSTPHPLGVFLLAKLAAGAIVMAVVSLVGLLLGVFFFDLSAARLPQAVVWCAFAGSTLMCFFLLIQLFATSQRVGNILTVVVLFPLMMIGGSFFPFEAMPGWMAQVGQWTPNGLAIVRLKEMLSGDLALGSLAMATAGIGAPAALAFFYSIHRLRTRFVIG